MFCKNCGKEVKDGVGFCGFCGAPISVTAPQQKSNPTKKWYQKTPVIILLIFAFFPLGLYLMWKYTDWSKAIKAVISAVVAIIALIAFIGDGAKPTATDSTTTTVSQTEKETVTTAEDKEVGAFTSISNLTNDEAKTIINDLKSVGVKEVEKVSVVGNQSDAVGGASFNISYKGYTVTLIVINKKTDSIYSGDITLFENGKVVNDINDYIFDAADEGKFIYYAEEYVKQCLISPSTAEFPGLVLERNEWKVSRKKDVVTISSYVDSQNGFGAMLRSNFIIQISYSTNECLYLELNGEILTGKYQR